MARPHPADLDIKYDLGEVLGTGFQSSVFKGKCNDVAVAIKRVAVQETLLTWREQNALSYLRHPNILQLLHVDEDDEFKYFVLELCVATVEDLCGNYSGPVPSNPEALLQMASGLLYIHQEKFIHRDIKPANILISSPSGPNSSVTLKISDFAFCKQVDLDGSATMSTVRGTEDWIAPELLPFINTNCNGARCHIVNDVFSMGCVFGYFLTRGIHPFGRVKCLIASRIHNGVYDLSGLNGEPPLLSQIVEGMIQRQPEQRAKLDEVCRALCEQFQLVDTSAAPGRSKRKAMRRM